MYIQYLDKDQRQALVILTYYVMVADHKVTAEEEALIDALEHELGIEPVHPGEMLVEPAFTLFRDRRSKMALMLKLSAVAHVDRQFHPSERAMLESCGERLGLSAEDVQEVIKWGRLHAELVTRAQHLVDG
ncbi:MAG: hypothetical protein ACM31L_13575 [Actinomycetota bacterium]